MSLKGKKVYTRKSSGGLYKWGVDTNSPKANKRNNIKGEFCTATAYSPNGEDSITKYVSQKQIVNGIVTYYAYVACDYVK